MDKWIEELDKDKQDKIRKSFTKAKNDDERLNILYNNHPKGQINIEPVKHLDDFFKCVRVASTKSTWYRGESREHDFLIPKIYRNIKEENIPNILSQEQKYFQEFKRRALAIVDDFDKNDFWSWYFLIQHYGGPTRLLDWTGNAGVALFMALDTSRERKDNPIIYLLSPTVLTDYAFKDIGKEDSLTGRVLYPGDDDTNIWIENLISKKLDIPESPIALLPPYSDHRIVSQKSCFTLFGKRLNGFVKDGQEITCPCCDRRVLHKIIIDGNSKDSLREELKKIGISSETIYPGLEGLTKDLNQEIFTKI